VGLPGPIKDPGVLPLMKRIHAARRCCACLGEGAGTRVGCSEFRDVADGRGVRSRRMIEIGVFGGANAAMALGRPVA